MYFTLCYQKIKTELKLIIKSANLLSVFKTFNMFAINEYSNKHPHCRKLICCDI